jgi:hypothetical protein
MRTNTEAKQGYVSNILKTNHFYDGCLANAVQLSNWPTLALPRHKCWQSASSPSLPAAQMRKRSIVVGLVLLFLVFPASLVAQTYLVDHYANNAGPGTTTDALLRLINAATGGSPVTSPAGDVCANIYVFDASQEMISCCSCRLTPNEVATASVGNQLTNNPLVGIIPTAGVIKILPTAAETAVCSPTAPSAPSDASLLMGFATHVQISGAATFVTETNIPIAPLGPDEAAFLPNTCLFVTYLGSGYGKGTCTCTGDTFSFGTGTYSISGTISGAGGSDATVNLTGYSTTTVTADAAGNYIFTNLGIGSYTVAPSKTGFTFTPVSRPATVTKVNSANVTGVNFSTVTYSISGAISGAGGPSATVNLTGTSSATVTADASGNYTFTGLQNGSYTVTPNNSRFSFAPTNRSVTLNSADVTGVNFSTAPDYSVGISPASQSALPNTTVSYTVNMQPINNFVGQLQMSCAGLPSPAVCNVPTTVAAGSSAQVSIQTKSLAPGNYNFTVTAAGGGNTRSASAQLKVVDFGATLSASSETIPTGSSAILTINVTGLNGFADPVTLTCTGAPAGVSCTINPNSISGSGAATMTITVNSRPVTAGLLTPGGHTGAPALQLLPAFIYACCLALFLIGRTRKARIAALALTCSLWLTVSCGGGGGSLSLPQPVTFTLTVQAAADQVTKTVGTVTVTVP